MNAAIKKKGSFMLPFSANNTTNKAVLQQRYDYIPVDFIKSKIIGLDKGYFLDNENLIFTPQFEKGTTDSIKYEYTEVDNMELKVYGTGYIVLSGSLHKFCNSGEHNHDQFTQIDYFNALDKIKSTFGINPYNMRILQLEYGVNIKPPEPTNNILNHLLQHKNKDFEQKICSDTGKYYQCELSDYTLKIYNKALQYNCSDEVLRIEIKQTNWLKYRKNGITTLHDFNEHNKTNLVQYLLNKWWGIIFYDPTNIITEKWHKYSNINFWRDLRSKSNKTQRKHANRLKEVNKTNGSDIQKQIYDEVVNTLNQLQGVRNFTLVENQRNCRLTGVDISMQKKNSFLLSHSGLYYLLNNDRPTFKRLKNLFLSDIWAHSNESKQVKEIAHNIRLKYNYRMIKHQPNQCTIFN